MEKTMTTNGTAMAAAREAGTTVWYGSNTAHAVDLRQVQGRTLSAADLGMRDRVVAGTQAGFGIALPSTGSAYPRLEAPPV
ncbi:hypothetical protein [Arthrobacter sp. NEB 688]|uniref:hypothetical protein n=1 Tax=Arthrobacter sp. NEB 688 TaxID=904039 RepID=UPI0015667EF2|nr:hypothetical protein [Arthrobacter sp. NEB 688]QKE84028.1 hypothetical protein HL663_08810 [Arthrobacter sp. NEB 688]